MWIIDLFFDLFVFTVSTFIEPELCICIKPESNVFTLKVQQSLLKYSDFLKACLSRDFSENLTNLWIQNFLHHHLVKDILLTLHVASYTVKFEQCCLVDCHEFFDTLYNKVLYLLRGICRRLLLPSWLVEGWLPLTACLKKTLFDEHCLVSVNHALHPAPAPRLILFILYRLINLCFCCLSIHI